MNSGIRSWVILILAVAYMGGCGTEANPGQPMDERDPLRVRTDTARGRLWVLGPDDVRIYDTTKQRLIRQERLRNWIVARYACAPDMVLDRAGSAIISSNMQPTLWRIDTGSFEVKEHEIRLQGRERLDVGFGALGFAADGMLLGVASPAGSLWRIDIDGGSARMLAPEAAYPNLCEFTAPFINDVERRHPSHK
jgi:hypothetical protein